MLRSLYIAMNIINKGKGLEDWSSILGMGGKGIFLFTIASRLALGPIKLPIQWVPGVGAPFRGGKGIGP
jgi:hypothetical protein